MISFGGGEPPRIDKGSSPFDEPVVVAHISSNEITESSGLAVSKCQTDVFWTHNDSGDGPYLYAFDSRGKKLGTWRMSEVRNADWEDMATAKAPDGTCYLYVGEIGDNDLKRDVHSVLRVPEPMLTEAASASSRKEPTRISKVDVLRFQYPNGRHNAEAMMVHPSANQIYVLSKDLGGPSEVFKLELRFNDDVQTASRIAAIALPALPAGFVTGGDISPDGKRVVLCDYYAGYELTLPHGAKAFDEIWNQKPVPFDLGPREIGESIAFADDANTVFATSENEKPPLIRVTRKQK